MLCVLRKAQQRRKKTRLLGYRWTSSKRNHASAGVMLLLIHLVARDLLRNSSKEWCEEDDVAGYTGDPTT